MHTAPIFVMPIRLAALGLVLLACSEPGPEDNGDPDVVSPNGFVTYTANDAVYRIAAEAGATPFNMSNTLDSMSSGNDELPAVSQNGKFITMTTSRFAEECSDWSCLAVIEGDLSAAEIVYIGEEPLRPNDRAAISNTGDLIVYPSTDEGPHDEDLFVIRKTGSTWSTPQLLTGDSTHDYNTIPVLSDDASKLLFNCGPTPYGQEGTGVCQVGTDGSGLERLVDPNQNGGSDQSIAHHGDYMTGGGIVFEADWDGEQIYTQAEGGAPVLVMPVQSNDNTPCALPSGSIASLWLGRPEGDSLHELKMMALDGSSFDMLTPDLDVIDVGLSCHK